MSPQTPVIIISLLILLTSLVLCNASYCIEEPLHQTNAEAEYYYPVRDGRLIKRKHQRFGIMTRTNRYTHFSSGTVSVDDYGAKADGRDDGEVTYQHKEETLCQFRICLDIFFYKHL